MTDKSAIQSTSEIATADDQLSLDQQHRMATALEAVADAVMLTDIKGHIEYVNAAFVTITGFSQQEVIGKTPHILSSGKEDPSVYASLWETLKKGLNWHNKITNQKKDGSLFEAEETIAPVRNHKGEVVNYISIVRDVTAQITAQQALKESEERYSIASFGANDGLWDWKINENSLYFSPRWKLMLGYENHELKNHINEWYFRVHEEDLAKLKSGFESYQQKPEHHFIIEYRIRNKANEYLWMLCRGVAIVDHQGNVIRMAGSQTDITEKKNAESKLKYEALHDNLTGLPNRHFFINHLKRCIAKSHRHDQNFAVLFLDLDRFKVVNDSLGHLMGDQLLAIFSKRLQDNLNDTDLLARLGGDEFVILVEQIDSIHDAIDVAEKVHDSMLAPFELAQHEIYSSTSIGIAISAPHYQSPEQVLRDADNAMYRAKAKGAARYEVFDISMHEQALKRLQTENELRHALENDELVVYFQPIISVQDHKISGTEALIRWRHPTKGLIPPGLFLDIAEETGLLITIDRFVISEAFKRCQEWNQNRDPEQALFISTNITGGQLLEPDFVDFVKNSISHQPQLCKHIRFEITEGVIMDQYGVISECLNQLKKLHIDFSIDDFGTGYSSLSRLHELPISTLKIDRGFVFRMHQKEENEALVNTIINLAHNLKMKVIAEGVETEKQARMLEKMGCDYFQGYLFSKPVDEKQIIELLAKDNFHW